MLLYRVSKIDISAEIRLCIDFLCCLCLFVVKRRHTVVWAEKTRKIYQCFISEIYRLHNWSNRSYRLFHRPTNVGSTFASVAPAAKSEVTCREADVSCRRVMQHGAGGEGSLSGHCLPSDASRLAACCRVKGPKLLLSCCCGASSVLWRLSSSR